MKNVFIEGIQGMGKSTLLNTVVTAYPQMQVCREGDFSPVDLAWCTWMTEDEYTEILDKYAAIKDEIVKNTIQENNHFIISYTKIITDIPGFHKHLENYEIYNGRKSFHEMKEIIFTRYKNFSKTSYVFECSFFQNIIEDLILFHRLSDDEILDFYKELFEIVDKEHFLLLYLYSDSLEENIKIIKKERSDDQGNELWYSAMSEFLIHSPYGIEHGYSSFDDMVAHFTHRQELEMLIIKEVVKDRAIVLPSKKWRPEEFMDAVR